MSGKRRACGQQRQGDSAALGEQRQTMADALHNLRNHLGAVVGYAELLLETKLPARVRRDLSKMLMEAERCADEVERLSACAGAASPRRAGERAAEKPTEGRRPAGRASRRRGRAAGGGKLRALVVEDQAILGEMIAEALGEAGFEAKLCPDAQEALRCLADDEYDIVVTDVNLPAMNGLRLFDLMRERQGGGEIPVVFVTGNARSAHTVAEIKRRGASLVTKPFSIHELLAVVRRALEP